LEQRKRSTSRSTLWFLSTNAEEMASSELTIVNMFALGLGLWTVFIVVSDWFANCLLHRLQKNFGAIIGRSPRDVCNHLNYTFKTKFHP
jgi:hypothetical protein